MMMQVNGGEQGFLTVIFIPGGLSVFQENKMSTNRPMIWRTLKHVEANLK